MSTWRNKFDIFILIGTFITLSSGIISKVKDKRLNLVVIFGGEILLIGPIIYLEKFIMYVENSWVWFTLNIVLAFLAGVIAILGGILGVLKRKS